MDVVSRLRGISNTKITLATQILCGFIASISLIAGARFCGAETIGQFALLTICLGIFADVVDFGSCSWVSREVAAGRISVREARLILSYRTKNIFFVAIIVGIIILLFFKEHSQFLIFLIYPVLFLQTNYIQQLLFAKDRVRLACLLQIIEKTIWLTIFPLYLILSSKLLLLILPIIFGGMLHSGIGRIFLSIFDEFDTNPSVASRTNLHFGIQSLVTDLGMLDTVLVGLLSSMSSAGVYNLGARVRAPFLLMFNSLISNLRKSFAEHDFEKAMNIVRKERLLLILFYLCIPVSSLVLLISATKIFGDSFLDLNRCLSIFVLSVIPQSLLFLCSNFLISVGEEKLVSNFSVIFTVLNLLLLSLLLSLLNLNVFAVSVYFFLATSAGTFFLLAKAYHVLKKIR